jgi:4-methyl-5(b-hydroxyethyl)-thiazole monophosphate biosynthesis
MVGTRVLVPFADGFEETEAITIVDVLRRAGINVDMAGIMGSMITGSHGIRLTMDKKIMEVRADDYDAIVLPGGNPGYINLGRSTALLDIIRKMNSQGKIIGAICAAPSVLAKAGILDGKKATIFPGMEKEVPYPRGDKVVVDGKIVTSQGPGTAMLFALKIVEMIAGRDMAASLKRSLVC